MLSLNNKIDYFEKILLLTDHSYNDEIKNEIYEDMNIKVDFLVSKIIMHEHHDSLNSIIEKYCL